MKTVTRWSLWLGFALLFILNAHEFFSLYIQGRLSPDFLFNSDATYLPLLYRDLLLEGGKLSQWFLTPAPYFFPDWLIYAAARSSVGQDFYAVFIQGLVQVVGISTAVYVIACQTGLSRFKAFLSFGLVLTLFIIGMERGIMVFLYSMMSAFHGGAFLCMLWTTAWFLRFEKKANTSPFELSLFSIFVFLVTLSDKLFFLQVVLPIVSIFLLRAILEKRWDINSLKFPIAATISGAIAAVSLKFVVAQTMEYPLELSVSKLRRNRKALIEYYRIITENNFWVWAPFTLFYLGFIGLLIYSFKKKKINFSKLNNLAAILFVSTSFVLFIELLIVSLPVTDRYLIAVFAGPICLLPIIIVRLCDQYLAKGIGLGLLVLALMSSSFYLVTRTETDKRPLLSAYYPDDVACFDKSLEGTGATHGISAYWDAKKTSALSQTGLRVTSVLYDLTPFRWIMTENWVSVDGYDFVISNSAGDGEPDLKIIEKLNGAPKSKHNCGTKQIWVYNKGALKTSPMENINGTIEWSGCDLKGPIGINAPNCDRLSNPDEQGALVTTPLVTFPAGNYAFEIEYSAIKGDGTEVGSWVIEDVLFEKKSLIAEGQISRPEGQSSILKGEFKTVGRLKSDFVTIKINSNGKSELVVKSVKFIRR